MRPLPDPQPRRRALVGVMACTNTGRKILCYPVRIRCLPNSIPCFRTQGIGIPAPCYGYYLRSLEWQNTGFGNFPVKFPVCRENGQSRVRITLLRQPASVASSDSPQMKRSYARNWRTCCGSGCLRKLHYRTNKPNFVGKSLGNHWRIPVSRSRERETIVQDTARRVAVSSRPRRGWPNRGSSARL
jgi:hypothetical protein